ncbi:hypothetical protein FRC10_005197, partial [Ceratobasidium sp. 414]
MSSPRVTFVVTADEMVKIGRDHNVECLFEDDSALARETAREIIEALPPVGWVRLHDALIDGRKCYAFMLGRKSSPNRVSSILVNQLQGLFGGELQWFVQEGQSD